MSQPLFVIVSDDESGGDNSVHTAVLDDQGQQKVVALSEANQFRQIPKEPKFSVVPRTPSGLAQWNASHRVTRYKCDMCAESFSKPYLLRNHRHRVHKVCLEAKSVPTRKSRAGKGEDKSESGDETSREQIPYKDFVPKRHLSAEEVRTEKLEKLVVKDSSVAIQIAAELEGLRKSEPKRPRCVSRKKYPCNVCGKPFASPSLLDRHRSVHTRERLYPCPHCPKKCAYTDERLRHIRRAHPEKAEDKTLEKYPSSFTCSICDGKTFTTKYRYTEHLKVHLNGLFQCQICNKKYAKRDNLVRHVQIHNGDKCHECEICGKRFLDMTSLRSHLQTHTGDYRYKCGVCEKGFSKKKSLYDHLQRHNDEENGNVFECKICWECLDSREELEAHQKLHVTAASAADPTRTLSPATTTAYVQQQLHQLGYKPRTKHSDNRQGEFSGHPQDDEHSGHMQVEFSGHAQSELSNPHQAEHSGHQQAEYSTHSQAEFSTHPQAEHSSHTQAEHSGCPQAEYSSHPAVDFSGHSIVDLSGHPRAEFSGHPQAEYSVDPHLHGSVTGVRGSSLELSCHICNKSFQSPEEVRLHERLHNSAEQNSHHFPHNYMNSHSTVTYCDVSSASSVYPSNEMSLTLDQSMSGTQHPHLLINL